MYPMFSISGLLQMITDMFQGQIQDFKLGGAHLKKLRRAEGGSKIVGVFRKVCWISKEKVEQLYSL
jgi:hypothetical protein